MNPNRASKTRAARPILGYVLAVTLLCFSAGCQSQNQQEDWERARCLDELVGFFLSSAPHSRWCKVRTRLEPGRTAPRAVVRREIVKYLERRPGALKPLMDIEPQSDFLHPWRGRDVWASVLADLEGVDLKLYRWDSIEERERKIADLLETVGSDGECQEQDTEFD